MSQTPETKSPSEVAEEIVEVKWAEECQRVGATTFSSWSLDFLKKTIAEAIKNKDLEINRLEILYKTEFEACKSRDETIANMENALLEAENVLTGLNNKGGLGFDWHQFVSLSLSRIRKVRKIV